MKYRIIEQRVNEQELLGKNLIVKEEDVMIDDNIFFGSWTDNFEEFKKDNTIELYCVVDNHSRICPHGNIKTITDLEIGDYATQNNEVAEVKGLYGSQYKYYANTDREYVPENTKINEVNDLYVDYVND